MTQKQISSLNMYINVLKYLDDKNKNWKANSVISNAVETFRSSVTTIQKSGSQEEESVSKNETPTNKEEERKILLRLIYKLALRIKNYAVSINNQSLKLSIDFSKHELETGKESDVINRCKKILNTAKDITKAPPEYKITPDFIAQVSAALDIVHSSAIDRTASNSSVNDAILLSNLFAKSSTQLHTLDDLIEGDADDEDADFVRNYFITRRTVYKQSR